ncbi:MAG: DMT family transporter [Thaumarchaeota archaeon]|nr:DMT family transporter [Nitrososphaerota archaeon]
MFGLLAAFFWGSTDFLSRFPSRKIGPAYSTAYVQLFSLIGFSAYVLLTGPPTVEFLSKGSSYLVIDLFVGMLNVSGLMLLYRSFTTGNMSLTAPIASSFPIFTILLGYVFLGQVIGAAKGIAIAIVISGVILSGVNLSSTKNNPSKIEKTKTKRLSNSVVSAFAASLFFGGAYLGLNLGLGYFGSVLSILFFRLGAVLFSFLFLFVTMKKLVLPTGGAWKWLLTMAILDSLGFASLTLGYLSSGNSPAVVTTLSSLLGAVTTILATVIYKDKLTRVQILGIVILFSGVVILLNV